MSRDAPAVELDVYPSGFADRDAWMPWSDWDRKQPNAEAYSDAENPYSYSDPANWTSFERAGRVANTTDAAGIGFVLQSRDDPYDDDPDPFVSIDYDDARDPETDRVHPVVREHIQRAGTYADVSYSTTGVHIDGIGALPEGVKTIDDDLPYHPEFPDASIEVYDGKRFMAFAGRHIEGTPRDVRNCQAFVDELADEFVTVAQATPDAITREPAKSRGEIADVETTTEMQDVFDAIQHTDPGDVRLRSPVTEERSDGSKSLDPSWDPSERGDKLAEIGDGWVFRDGMRGLDALQVVALEERIITSEDEYPSGEAFWRAVEALRERGAHIPEFDGSTDGEGENGEQYAFETCSPPIYDPVDVDREQQWAKFQGPRLDDWLARPPGTLEVFADPAGDGKTTSVPLGLDDRDESHVVLVPKHENCYEFQHDPAKPDGYYHHKGSGQPREECCMEADAEADEGETPECETHGHPSNWPRMCPIHTRDKDDSVRASFEAIEREVGTERAHEIVDPHDGERCAWQRSHDTLASAERVVTVHNYLIQKTVQDVGKVVVDDLQQLPIDKTAVSVPALLAAANRMDSIGRANGTPGMLTGFARFVRDVVDVMTGGFGDDPDVEVLEDLTPPEIPSDEVRELREYQGTNFQHSRVTGHAHGEPIARAKVAYNGTVINRMRDGRWEAGDEPLCFDSVIALAAKAGLDSGPAYRAIAVPAELDSCPVCTADLGTFNGKRVCEDCGWDEESGLLVRPDDEKARAQTRLVPASERGEGEPVVEYQTLPLPSELPAPEGTLILDATPRPDVIGALWGVDPEDVVITGNEPRQLNATITQVSNGQFHRSTIARDDEYGEHLREKHQRWIDRRSETCEKFLVVSHKSNRRFYDLPDNAEWMHFHAARGLDRSEYDGVVVIGAPHPNVEAIQRDAELLAMHRDDVRVGGEEHSTRADAPNPPVYRKLFYEDENGEGREIATKHFTGLVGAMFRAGREDELVQVAHRVRPGQADHDDEKFIDLLTNIPTDLPVDQFVRLEELTEPLSVMFPVPDAAVDLTRAVRDVLTGDGPNGFRASQLVRQLADGTVVNNRRELTRLAHLAGVTARGKDTPPTYETVCNWVDQLEAIGLLTPGEYEQRSGVVYEADISTLNSALQVLSCNGFFKVAAVRRFREKVTQANGSLDWLAWAETVFDLTGDRCGWDPPPASGT